MPTIGFSAFLKLACLNPLPLRSEVRKRVSEGGGYDFHRIMRLLARQMATGRLSLDTALIKAAEIHQKPERTYAVAALSTFQKWQTMRPGRIVPASSVTLESPLRHFAVRFDPDFAIDENGHVSAYHLWNTQTPDLQNHIVGACLSAMLPLYETNAPDSLRVLSLLNLDEFRSETTERSQELGLRIVAKIDAVFDEVLEQLKKERARPASFPSGPGLPPPS